MAQRMASTSFASLILRACSVTAARPGCRSRAGRRPAPRRSPSCRRRGAGCRRVRAQQVVHLGREAPRELFGALAGQEVEEGRRGPDLVDERQVVGEVHRLAVLEQDDGAVGRDEAGPRGVVGDPDLHVGRVGRVADVEGVEDEEARAVVAAELAAQPFQPVFAERGQVRYADPRRLPFRKARAVGPISMRSGSSGEPSGLRPGSLGAGPPRGAGFGRDGSSASERSGGHSSPGYLGRGPATEAGAMMSATARQVQKKTSLVPDPGG